MLAGLGNEAPQGVTSQAPSQVMLPAAPCFYASTHSNECKRGFSFLCVCAFGLKHVLFSLCHLPQHLFFCHVLSSGVFQDSCSIVVSTAVAVQVLRSRASVGPAAGQSIAFAVNCEQQDLPWPAPAQHHVASAVAFIVDNMLFVIVFLFAFV